MLTFMEGEKMKRLLTILIVGILIVSIVGGCTLTLPELLIIDKTGIQCRNTERNNKAITLRMKWPALKFDNK